MYAIRRYAIPYRAHLTTNGCRCCCLKELFVACLTAGCSKRSQSWRSTVAALPDMKMCLRHHFHRSTTKTTTPATKAKSAKAPTPVTRSASTPDASAAIATPGATKRPARRRVAKSGLSTSGVHWQHTTGSRSGTASAHGEVVAPPSVDSPPKKEKAPPRKRAKTTPAVQSTPPLDTEVPTTPTHTMPSSTSIGELVGPTQQTAFEQRFNQQLETLQDQLSALTSIVTHVSRQQQQAQQAQLPGPFQMQALPPPQLHSLAAPQQFNIPITQHSEPDLSLQFRMFQQLMRMG
jgi:hypothetical protein